MIYALVIITALACIALALVGRRFFQHQNVRRIVQGMHHNIHSAEERTGTSFQDASSDRNENEGPRKSPRLCAIELQQVRTLLRDAEKAIAKQDLSAAEIHLIQALTIQPKARDVQARLARLYLDTKREKKAEALYRNIVQEIKTPALFANLGLACYQQKAYVDACEAYQEALNLDPRTPQRSADLGRACLAAHRFKEAAPLLKKACDRLSRNKPLHELLARCYLQLNDKEHAEEIYRWINKIDPRDELVKERLREFAQA